MDTGCIDKTPTEAAGQAATDSTQIKRRSRDITELKQEASNLKLSLSSLTSAREKTQARERAAVLDKLYDLCETTCVRIDKRVLEHLVELFRLGVHPENMEEFLRTVMLRVEKEEKVSFV